MNLLLIAVALLFYADVAAGSSRIHNHLRGRIAKSDKIDSQVRDNTVAGADADEPCQVLDMDNIFGTKWNLTHFTWGDLEAGQEETLQPVDLTRERRGMTLLIEDGRVSGTCGNNMCWGVTDFFEHDTLQMFWIHDLARTRMMSTPQEEKYAKMLVRSPYIFKTCVDSSTEHTQLHLFEADIDNDDNLVQGRIMAIYNQIELPML
jgi:hypothetical protein